MASRLHCKAVQAGFSLMELIGVLAVMAILSAMLAPSVFDTINDAISVAEDGNVEAIGQSLEQHIIATSSIPSGVLADWSAAVATKSSYPLDQIATNRRGFNRAVYFDPRFFTGSDSNFGGYVQTAGLGAAPVSPRVMVISDLSGNVPNLPASGSVFDAIWNQTTGATYVESNDVKIYRLHLGRLFHRVLLTNTKTAQAGYTLEGQSASPIPAASGAVLGSAERYVLYGTHLTLLADPYPAGAALKTTIVTQSGAFTYQDNGTYWYWSGM